MTSKKFAKTTTTFGILAPIFTEFEMIAYSPSPSESEEVEQYTFLGNRTGEYELANSLQNGLNDSAQALETYLCMKSEVLFKPTTCFQFTGSPYSQIPVDMVPQEILDEFKRFTNNDIPLRLVFIPDMKLVGRSAVQAYFQPSIEEITESDIIQMLSPDVERESAIRKLVREKVRYAILSHRWLVSGEPSFRELMKGTASGAGYQKLRKFCEVARGYGLVFAWLDTCCIDKSSSAEFEEAIRSMFRWYRNAAICITYLTQTTSIQDLESDEWFKRGWTLQELLAPRTIKFFKRDWQPLTTLANDIDEKSPILWQLSRVTGIGERDLLDFEPGPYHIDDRMSWAAGRKTTKEEDVAYSLIGIFDVGLQVLYGEGSEVAFSRLIEVIMRANGHASVLNWTGKPAASHSSKALPSSPASYLGHPHFNSAQKIDLAVTSRGLRIPLIVLPIQLLQFGQLDYHTIQAEFQCDLYGIGDITVELYERILGMKNRDWALGIFNYMPLYGNRVAELAAIRHWSTAYLLSRRRVPQEIRQEKLHEFSLVHDDPRYYGWSKVSTRTFVGFSTPTIPENEVMIVAADLVETVYL